MDNSLVVVIIVLIGLVLVYAAIKGTDPREVIKQALRRG